MPLWVTQACCHAQEFTPVAEGNGKQTPRSGSSTESREKIPIAQRMGARENRKRMQEN